MESLNVLLLIWLQPYIQPESQKPPKHRIFPQLRDNYIQKNGLNGQLSKSKNIKQANEADKNNGEVECICGLCCEPVKDEEDKELYCEGACASGFIATALE